MVLHHGQLHSSNSRQHLHELLGQPLSNEPHCRQRVHHVCSLSANPRNRRSECADEALFYGWLFLVSSRLPGLRHLRLRQRLLQAPVALLQTARHERQSRRLRRPRRRARLADGGCLHLDRLHRLLRRCDCVFRLQLASVLPFGDCLLLGCDGSCRPRTQRSGLVSLFSRLGLL